MSHPQPPQRQPTLSETERYAKAVHTTALVILVACPVLILLPPRKLDFYTFGLCGATVYSANYLVRERTGRSIWQLAIADRRRVEGPLRPKVDVGVGRIEQAMREQKTEERIAGGIGTVSEQVASQRDAWKVQREKEIKEDVEEGKGFGDMIVDQIWEVWNWGRKRDDDDDDDEDD